MESSKVIHYVLKLLRGLSSAVALIKYPQVFTNSYNTLCYVLKMCMNLTNLLSEYCYGNIELFPCTISLRLIVICLLPRVIWTNGHAVRTHISLLSK